MDEKIEKENEVFINILNKIYEISIKGYKKIKPASVLAEEFLNKKGSLEEKIDKLIKSQSSNSAMAGFVTGLGGLPAMKVTIPMDLSSMLFIHLRMIATIAIMTDHSIDEEEVKTLVFACLLGESGIEFIRTAGIVVSKNIAKNTIKNISGKTLVKINQKIGFRFITKFGQKGVVNLGKGIPIVGGFFGAGVNLITTLTVGKTAKKMFLSSDNNHINKIIQIKKESFLNEYNKEKSIHNAVTSSINIALKRNKLYSSNIKYEDKGKFKKEWSKLLIDFSNSYENQSPSVDVFISQIESMKNKLNQKYGILFDPSTGFRLSHAQKSLSVFLKHLWCMDKISIPPVCPIDRTILLKIHNKPDSWTKINSLNKYLELLDLIKNEAELNNLNVAEWELINF